MRLKRLQYFSHLRETIDTQLGHTIISLRNVTALESASDPRERRIVASILVKTYRRHEAHPAIRIRTPFYLEHETPVSVQEARNIRTFYINI